MRDYFEVSVHSKLNKEYMNSQSLLLIVDAPQETGKKLTELPSKLA